MNQESKTFVAKVFRKASRMLGKASDKLLQTPSRKLADGADRSLYETPSGDKYWLNHTGYIDLSIINRGYFEKATTNAINTLVKEGDTVLDIGANFGYYTVMLSRIVGPEGKVIAFEPTQHYRNILLKNIEENNLPDNIEIIETGLSNKDETLEIDIGISSATLHSPEGFDKVIGHEKITLSTLDKIAAEKGIDHVDFIKIDVDGHEPIIFEGAWKALEKLDPIIIFEVSHLHYLEAGVKAWDFYDDVRQHGYHFYYEDTLKLIDNQQDFLRRCCNFDVSSNVLISKIKQSRLCRNES